MLPTGVGEGCDGRRGDDCWLSHLTGCSPVEWVHLVWGQLICRGSPIFFQMRKSRKTNESRGGQYFSRGARPRGPPRRYGAGWHSWMNMSFTDCFDFYWSHQSRNYIILDLMGRKLVSFGLWFSLQGEGVKLTFLKSSYRTIPFELKPLNFGLLEWST